MGQGGRRVLGSRNVVNITKFCEAFLPLWQGVAALQGD